MFDQITSHNNLVFVAPNRPAMQQWLNETGLLQY